MTSEAATRPGLAARTRIMLWGAIVALLVLPMVAMQFTTEVNWGAEDFAAAALLLGGAGLALEAAARLVAAPGRRALAAVAIVGLLLLVWAELAVGLFD